MKKIILILAITLGFFSCQREEIIKKEPITETSTIEKTQQNEVDIFLFFQEDNLDGEIDVYFGDSLEETFKSYELVIRDTFLQEFQVSVNFINIKLSCSDAELTEADNWFHVVARFKHSFEHIHNVNEFNGEPTFCNDNINFLEPSFICGNTSNSNTVFSNTFWVKPDDSNPPPVEAELIRFTH